MEIKENQYLSLKLDLGVLGEQYLIVSKNTKKEKPSDPDVRISVRSMDNQLKGCGAGWINTKKEGFSPSIQTENIN